jgi:tRNA pseudouridine32 synthase/23S rRNA pseudouridine746 synthase
MLPEGHRDSGSVRSPKEMLPKPMLLKPMPPKEMTPEQMVSRLLYRDGLMLVIDKPPGFAVHRGPKGGESLEDHFGALRFGLPRPPALAHRLDRDTSGCLVLGRHRKALAQLGKLFKTGAIGKTYWAVVEGGPEAEEGQIELPLGRLDVARGWWMKHDPSGQPAVTKWKVMERNSFTSPRKDDGTALTWLALEPLTGRTHQLRVHCTAMGWPIVGDAIYGTAPRAGGPPLHLHAREVVVPLYKNRSAIRVTAPVPEHMRAALSQCGWRDENAPNRRECFAER